MSASEFVKPLLVSVEPYAITIYLKKREWEELKKYLESKGVKLRYREAETTVSFTFELPGYNWVTVMRSK
jgi:hypothetical protein